MTIAEISELLLCPFCNGKMEDRGYGAVHVDGAGCPIGSLAIDVKAWNRRPSAEPRQAQVKALEWHQSHTGMPGDAHTIPTLYTVRFVDDLDGGRWIGLGGHGYEMTSDAAKAAAQADYDARIRSALVSTTAPGLVEASVRDVLAERKRQIEVEGWTPEHDDEHNLGELARAAACYARPEDVSYTDNYGRSLDDEGHSRPFSTREIKRSWSYVRALRWPWDRKWWKPSKDRRRNLIKAGALILAEIDRIDRLTAALSSITETGGAK